MRCHVASCFPPLNDSRYFLSQYLNFYNNVDLILRFAVFADLLQLVVVSGTARSLTKHDIGYQLFGIFCGTGAVCVSVCVRVQFERF